MLLLVVVLSISHHQIDMHNNRAVDEIQDRTLGVDSFVLHITIVYSNHIHSNFAKKQNKNKYS